MLEYEADPDAHLAIVERAHVDAVVEHLTLGRLEQAGEQPVAPAPGPRPGLRSAPVQPGRQRLATLSPRGSPWGASPTRQRREQHWPAEPHGLRSCLSGIPPEFATAPVDRLLG